MKESQVLTDSRSQNNCIQAEHAQVNYSINPISVEYGEWNHRQDRDGYSENSDRNQLDLVCHCRLMFQSPVVFLGHGEFIQLVTQLENHEHI